MFSKLFSPIQITGKITLKNRIVMAPMATNFTTSQGDITELNKIYYKTRALGGIGLIIVECSNIDPAHRHRPKCITISDDKFIPGLAELTAVIHEGGASVIIQLGHPGRLTSVKDTGSQPIAPSAVPNPAGEVPHALTVDEIAKVQELFVAAAMRAKQAGFDGVEIHGAHGYLLMEFVSPYTNKRTDAYGGNLKNRMRFPLEIVNKVRQAAGSDFLISYRMSATEFRPDGFSLDEAIPFATELEKAGANVLHISAGNNEQWDTMIKGIPMGDTPPGCFANFSAAIKKAVNIPVITVGRIDTPEVAEKILLEGQADIVALGRPLIADCKWPMKAKAGRSADINKCVACNSCLLAIAKHESVSCAVNPWVGQEDEGGHY